MATEIEKGRKWQYFWNPKILGGPGCLTPDDQSLNNFLTQAAASDYDRIRLVPEKKLVPWTELPPGVWVRLKNSPNIAYQLIEIPSGVKLTHGATGSTTYSYADLLSSFEYTTDLKTWHPCGTGVEEGER
jgi:hypothetical protein